MYGEIMHRIYMKSYEGCAEAHESRAPALVQKLLRPKPGPVRRAVRATVRVSLHGAYKKGGG